MKKHNLLLILVLLCTSINFAQNTDTPLSGPNLTEPHALLYDYTMPEDKIKSFKERSIGIMYMPIPLFINEINVSQNGNTIELTSGDNIVNGGIGLVANYDFNSSGVGLGYFMYGSYLFGDKIDGYDVFAAFKWDFKIGDPLTTNFEASPTLGLGIISLHNKDLDANYGNSFYFSGGARLTYRISNTFYIGGDVLLSPILFDKEGLLGLHLEEDPIDDVEIKYKSPVTINFSIRANLN
ncbi:MAG: hypothetical protein KDC62_10575 [Aequorivita sp.]|nr:hypothetical protein [Aequorivita sp.]